MADQGTRLETEDDVRRVLDQYRTARVPAATANMPAATAVNFSPAFVDDAPQLFRPNLRPPTAMLTVCDDGSEEGEVIRIRKERFVIGRTEGDLTIGHDSQISSRHAELRHSLVRDKNRWTLIDLKSTNGTYVRVGQALLESGQVFLIGSTRYCFVNSPVAGETAASPQVPEQGTRFWQGPAPAASGYASGAAGYASGAAIVQLVEHSDGPRFPLDGAETWIGRDAAQCRVAVPSDPLLNARHAKLRRQPDGRWMLENNKSVNGVWVRVEHITFVGVCRFMIGEQKFTIRTPQ